MKINELLEGWSNKYKRSINCNNPKGFSQRAHCQGRKKNESIEQDDIHNLADKKGIPWDNDKKFLSLSKRLTGVAHLDQMNQQQLKKMHDYLSSLDENFADGKVKGKSRPGRVKRAGASCNGSVTDLRSRAKNASGEKAKMYHWCANMKSGRKK